MDKEGALQIIWDYMHLHHTLKKADAILVLGSTDVRVGEYAAELWLQGWAAYLVCAGSGSLHNDQPLASSTEAEIFAQIAQDKGVPESAIIIENQSQNTGQNFEFALRLLAERGIALETLIVVQKPYMERRTYATGKVWLPNVDLIITSPPVSMADYPNKTVNLEEQWIHTMVGDLQRIKDYPAKGFQIEQEVPESVFAAYEFLVSEGYTRRLIKS